MHVFRGHEPNAWEALISTARGMEGGTHEVRFL